MSLGQSNQRIGDDAVDLASTAHAYITENAQNASH